jgi:hypothetical protein
VYVGSPHGDGVRYVGVPHGDGELEGYTDLLYRDDQGLVVVEVRVRAWPLRLRGLLGWCPTTRALPGRPSRLGGDGTARRRDHRLNHRGRGGQTNVLAGQHSQ